MQNSVYEIPLLRLGLMIVPVLIVLGILYRWSAGWATGTYAIARMLVQLLLVGYLLSFIFQTSDGGLVLAVLTIMILAASWISLRPLGGRKKTVYLRALASISIGGVLTLILVTQGVLHLGGWFNARFVIPLAGMIFASSMNSVSLAGERFQAERERGQTYTEARHTAYKAALIPLINSLFAVGVVSLPGMMTGQILAGVEPLVAARYQIMVMTMIFGASGISAASFLALQREE